MRLSMQTVVAALLMAAMITTAGCRKNEKPASDEQSGPPVMIGGESWPIFRGDQALRGVAEGELPDALKVKWKFKTQDAVRSSAVIADGLVFIGSDDGHIYAIDAATGKKVWSYKTKDAVEAPPLVIDGSVYVGSRDSFFYALDAKTGVLKWKYETGTEITGSANWTKSPDGKTTWIVVGSHDYRLYCFDAADGNVVWTYKSDNFINGAPAVYDGKVFFGGCDALIHEVSLADGTRLGQIETGSYIAGSAAVDDGKVYLGNYDNILLCGDLASREVAWEYTGSEDAFFSSPALTENVVIAGARDDRLHCISRSGEAVWTFSAGGDVDSSPVICGEKAVFGCEDGRFYMVRLADGVLVWSFDLGQPIISSPAVAAGLVVVGCDDGFVYAFNAK